jgi:hypothetical protein
MSISPFNPPRVTRFIKNSNPEELLGQMGSLQSTSYMLEMIFCHYS